MRKINWAGLELIKKFEGFRPVPYICPAGKPTIGYGHAIKKGENFPRAITVQEAEKLLMTDVAFAERAVGRLVRKPLNSNQFSALVSFVYNVGTGAFMKSSLLKVVNRGEHDLVPEEFTRWVYVRGKLIHGLSKRRQAEALLYTTA